MGFQLVSFPRRSARSFDWTRDELAELYRIEHALVQANIRLETDQGLSDEGDPWFVFCGTDGEVLVHISRYDGEYRLYSPGLANSLVGRSFAELTKSFVRQVPVRVSFQQRDGAQLFVHPAAMLAVIIGTLFVASNDLYLFSPRSELGKHTDDGWDLASSAGDRSSFKHTLQTAFASYIETFLGSLRDASVLQQSSYLSLISAIAAFVIESTVSTVDQAPNGIAGANIIADGSALADGSSSQHNALMVSSVADDGLSSHKNATNENSTQKTTIGTVEQQISDDDANADTVHQIWAVDSSPPANRLAAQLVHDNAFSPSPIEKVLSPNDFTAEDNAGHLATRATLVPFLSNLNSSSTGSSASTAGNSHASAEPPQTSTSPQTSTFSNDINGLLAHAFNIAAENSQLNTVLLNFGNLTANAGTVIATADTTASSTNMGTPGTKIPTFDTVAQATLVAFFKANPDAPAIFYHGNIIVSDGVQNDPNPVIVMIWEVGSSGETISIVGHADHGLIV